VDVAGSELDLDLAAGALPWKDRQFSAIAAQQVIEHLELQSELLPLFSELRRIAKPNAEIWLSCPDLGRVCAAYAEDSGAGLIEDRLTRPNTGLGMDGVPPQQMINNLFQQSGEHRNLLDFELAAWALRRSGFGECEKVDESQLLRRFPEFPRRNDDRYSLYIKAKAV
jgi:predicted SAM-dependent methyltransferase